MKTIIKSTLLSLTFILGMNICYCQDILVVDNGDEMKVKVIDVTADMINYNKWEDQGGRVYSVAKKYIFMIKYANGTKEVFSNSNNTTKEVSKSDSEKVDNSRYTGPIKITEPEFDGFIIYANDSVGNGIRLEIIHSELKDTYSAFGAIAAIKQAKDGSTVIVKGCCSSVRTNQKANLNFLVLLQERVDPVEYIKVFKLKKEKKLRSVKAFNIDYGGINKDVSVEDNKEGYLKFTYKKYGQRHYLITIDSLEPGEYAITLNSGKLGDFNLFGVD